MTDRQRGTQGARLNRFFRKAREPVFVLNKAGRVLAVNPAWEELTGLSAEAARRLRCRAGARIEDPATAELARCFRPPRAALRGDSIRVATRIPTADGSLVDRWIEFRAFRRSDTGNPLGVLGVILDAPAAGSGVEPGDDPLAEAIHALRARLNESIGTDQFIGEGMRHDRLIAQMRIAAGTRAAILIEGEAGAGKRLAARIIHQTSPDRSAPFLIFNVGATPPELLEQDLLGRARDAGRVAHFPPGATLVLGDLADLTRDLQARLAREWDRLEGCRLIVTTRKPPEELLASEKLLEEFHLRVSALRLRVPPLRERLEELPLLAQHLLERANLGAGRTPRGFAESAMDALLAYDWPGNVRELGRAIDHARRHGGGDRIELEDLPRAILGARGAAYNPPPEPIQPLEARVAELERRCVIEALERARGNQSRAAEWLGLSRPRLHRKLRELGIDPREFGGAPED